MKKNQSGKDEMDLATYKLLVEDIASGRMEMDLGVTLNPETIQMAKAKLKEIEKIEARM